MCRGSCPDGTAIGRDRRQQSVPGWSMTDQDWITKPRQPTRVHFRLRIATAATRNRTMSRQEEGDMSGDVRVAALVVSLSALVGRPIRAAEPVVLLINVIDYSHAASGILSEAQHHVARVYGAAGITVSWREGKPSPTAAAGQLCVLLLSDSMAAQKAATEKIGSDVLGTAAPAPARRAWIFLTRVEDIAARLGLSTGLVLGHVIAHEVAHTVANVEHADAGLMSAKLFLTADALQGFSDRQSQQLRRALQQSSDPATLEARDRSRPFRPGPRTTR
jgi:hypothetical protein